MYKFIFCIYVTFIVLSCNNSENVDSSLDNNDSASTQSGLIVIEKNGITLSELSGSQEYMDAKLELASPSEKNLDTGLNKFSYKVSGTSYQLGNQTEMPAGNVCANSAKGQHIHLIVNNEPYQAFYTNEFESQLKEGNNVVLAFLSRSYHESIKTDSAYVLAQFNTGKMAEPEVTDLNNAFLFYSRPNGTYIGGETKKILLDFYLVNTEISENGNKVKAIINGTEFILTKWVPYIIEGLPMGENKITLELIDKEGNIIPGKFNFSGERVFVLEDVAPADK
jgi:hypothetical protein